MVDKEKLRYDLALSSAVVMTLRNNVGNPPNMMLINFLNAYHQYEEKYLSEELTKSVEELNQNSSS